MLLLLLPGTDDSVWTTQYGVCLHDPFRVLVEYLYNTTHKTTTQKWNENATPIIRSTARCILKHQLHFSQFSGFFLKSNNMCCGLLPGKRKHASLKAIKH